MGERHHPALVLRVLRSSQTDAEQLDDELLSLFKASFLHGSLAVFHAARLAGHHRELLLVLQSIVFGLSIARGRPSPGMSLLNLRYRDERRSSVRENEGPPLTKGQRTLLYLGNIVLPYVWTKTASLLVRCMDGGDLPGGTHRLLERRRGGGGGGGGGGQGREGREEGVDENKADDEAPAADIASPLISMAMACRLAVQSSASGVWNAMQSIEATWKALELANHVAYIRHGIYRGALERLVGARLVYSDVGASRHISFDYLNRQLIWSEVSDFVLFVLPLLHAGSVGRLVNKYLPMNESIRGSAGRTTMGADATCPVCETTRESPARCCAVPCKHAYCYYCLVSRLGTSVEPRCYVCSERIRRVEML